CLHYNSAPLTF
nr:immunoglobulin light chain junction region [Macaca mulatta]MOV81050.1 immunoglobulin light chain junction region [Macaca mulatta]